MYCSIFSFELSQTNGVKTLTNRFLTGEESREATPTKESSPLSSRGVHGVHTSAAECLP